jgi:hypothetical protein
LASKIETDSKNDLPDETETVIFTPKSTREAEQFQTAAPSPSKEEHGSEPTDSGDDWGTNQATGEIPEQVAEEQLPEEAAIEGDDWWTTEPDTADTSNQEVPQQQVIKLKASPPPRVRKKQLSDTDNWWSAEEE